jgi:putative ABC transport system permease protein
LDAVTFIVNEWWILIYALIVGIVASIIPAWNAYKEDIAGQLSK